ncbi:UNVERIFIED_CONTAM: hypothetical protein O8I53_08545 [Campylobacter lari]
MDNTNLFMSKNELYKNLEPIIKRNVTENLNSFYSNKKTISKLSWAKTGF